MNRFGPLSLYQCHTSITDHLDILGTGHTREVSSGSANIFHTSVVLIHGHVVYILG